MVEEREGMSVLAKTPSQPLPTGGRGFACRARCWSRGKMAGSLPPGEGDGRQARGGFWRGKRGTVFSWRAPLSALWAKGGI
jgi:hypothetical protein